MMWRSSCKETKWIQIRLLRAILGEVLFLLGGCVILTFRTWSVSKSASGLRKWFWEKRSSGREQFCHGRGTPPPQIVSYTFCITPLSMSSAIENTNYRPSASFAFWCEQHMRHQVPRAEFCIFHPSCKKLRKQFDLRKLTREKKSEMWNVLWFFTWCFSHCISSRNSITSSARRVTPSEALQ